MRILLTNDDGVDAEGIAVLAETLSTIAEVVVIAPDRDQSGVSHSLSLHRPLRVQRRQTGWYAVDGTPTDCVYLGLHHLLEERPSLVVSGINRGPNLGTDVHYSGTVAGAVEGTLMGVSAIAVSCVDRKTPGFAHAARFVARLAENVLAAGGLPKGTTLNVNVPKDAPATHRRTFLGHRLYAHSVERRLDPRGNEYLWIGGNPGPQEDEPGSDSHAVQSGVISVTPLMLDLTDYAQFGEGPLAFEGFAPLDSIPPPAGYKLGTCC